MTDSRLVEGAVAVGLGGRASAARSPRGAARASSAGVRPASLALFGMVCLIWGLTWIPIKIAVTAVPPVLFAAVRGLSAGFVLLSLYALHRGLPRLARRHVPRVLAVGLLSNALTYGLLFWAMQRVDSGLAAVVDLSLTPSALLVFGCLAGEERLTALKVASTLLGIGGLLILNSAVIGGAAGDLRSVGIAVVAASAIVYAMGAVGTRELLRHYPATLVAGWVQCVGGVLLLAATLAAAPSDLGRLAGLAEPRVLLSWAFLVVFGSVIAHTAFLHLTHEWSPSAAGLFAFVSPVIAVVAGTWLLDESISFRDLVGMATMLAGTLVALWARAQPDPATAAVAPAGGSR